MKDLAWLNHMPTPAFAFKVDGRESAHILFWNEAMEDHSEVDSELALGGKLTALSNRLLRTALRRAKTANLGSLGTFSFKTINDDIVIASQCAAAGHDSEDEKVMFLAMAAHDLRSPLRHISGLLEEVRDGFQDMGDGKLELLAMIEDVADRARLFTNDVITYTWPSHVQQPETAIVDMLDLANDIFQSVDPAQKHALSCPTVCADTDKLALQIALRNLFDNAVRHGGREGMQIELKLEECSSTNSVRFTVIDNGKGLAPSADFFVAATDFRKSSSFGLMGVKRLIEERGGEISAIDTPNKEGSAITFTLPGSLIPEEGAQTMVG